MKPDWGRAAKSENESEEIIETDIMTNGGFGFATPENMEEWRKTKKNEYVLPHTKLVIVKNKKTKAETGFFMTVAGEKGYLEQNRFNLGGNHYKSPAKGFNGYVFFHNLDGSFSNGWKYSDGKVTHTTSLNFINLPVLQLKSASACQITTIYYWKTICTDHYYMAYYVVNGVTYTTGWKYNYTSCTSTLIYGGSITACSYIDEGSGESGSYTGGTTATQQTVLSDPLKKLFAKGTGNLSSTDISNLNNAYSNMNYDCMFNFISNQINTNNITVGEVNLNTTMIGVAGWSPTGNLSFGDSEFITSEYLSHEWFHLAQWKLNGVNIFNTTYKGMAEFENALFADIRETVRMSGNIINATGFACYNGSNDDYRVDYQNWLKSITSDGTTYPTSINQTDFNKWANVFGDVSPYKKTMGYDYSITSYSPKTMFSLFNNCQIF